MNIPSPVDFGDFGLGAQTVLILLSIHQQLMLFIYLFLHGTAANSVLEHIEVHHSAYKLSGPAQAEPCPLHCLISLFQTVYVSSSPIHTPPGVSIRRHSVGACLDALSGVVQPFLEPESIDCTPACR
jgi:hypothetical protein